MPTKAYREGLQAYYQRRSSPYHSGSYSHGEWLRGYYAARDGKSSKQGLVDDQKGQRK